MNNLGDYLGKKAQKLDLGRGDDLAQVQKMLDEWYPGKVRAQSLNNGKLVVVTTSSSIANELRFKTSELLAISSDITKVIIR
jgi:hypothetical protein